MYIFEESLNKVRKGDGTVFKGLGIRHNDPISEFCDSSDEVVITQCAAEAAILLRDIILSDNAENRLFWEKDGGYICFDFFPPREWRYEGLVPLRYFGYLEGDRMFVGGASYDGLIKPDSADNPEYYIDVAYMMLAQIKEIITDNSCCAAFTRLLHNLSKQNIAEFCAAVLSEEKMCVNYLLGFLPDVDFKSASMNFDDFKKKINPPPIGAPLMTSDDDCGDSAPDSDGGEVEQKSSAKCGSAKIVGANPAKGSSAKRAGNNYVTHDDIVRFDLKEFAKEYRELIPQLPSEFVIPDRILALCNAVTAGDITSMLIHGPAGTGKTMSCKLICQEIGLPIMATINCTENLDEFVLGKFLPENDKIVFRESYVTKAIRDGGAVVFEEINFAKPQYLAFLNSLLDDNGFVRLDNGQTVKRNKNFRFFATMNIGYYGTKDLNQALYNRFGIVAELSELSDEAVGKMLAARVPECSKYVNDILFVYHRIKHMFEADESDCVISPRNLEAWARMAKYLGFLIAAEYTIISTARADRKIEDSIRKIVSSIQW